MTVLIVLAALAACGFLLDRLTAAPGARGVPVSARLAEARRIAVHHDESPARERELVGAAASPRTR